MKGKTVTIHSHVEYKDGKYDHYVEIDSLRTLLKRVAEANPDVSVLSFADYLNGELTRIKNQRKIETLKQVKR